MRQLSLFKGKRQRGTTAAAPLEYAYHCIIADLLQRWCSSSWRYSHMPAGEHRQLITAVRLKRMGVKPGWPDFQFAGPNAHMFFLELKRRGSRLSEEQQQVHAHLRVCGFDVRVCDDVKAAVETLQELGILPATIGVQ